jgi:two-component system, NarL family, nitrate/nitrite response regulator NarL
MVSQSRPAALKEAVVLTERKAEMAERVDGSRADLTNRELEVLRLLAEGLSAPEIGKRLYIEPSTVKTHLKHLYAKLGVGDRAAAVATGMRQGILE